MNGQNRADIKPGTEVEVVLKEDQGTGELTRGIVAEILTSSDFHPRGIKVRLEDGQVGRVQKIIFEDQIDSMLLDNLLDKIYDTAEMFRKTIDDVTGIKLAYDEQSIFKLDELIEQILSSEKPPDLEDMISLFACFFGEALNRTLKGHWKPNKNGNMAVELQAANGDRVDANVFSKVEKRFRNGMEDSLTYYYQMLEKLLADKDFLSNTRK